MAVAPLNRFITLAVPVAPGEQVIYTTPTGYSSILLYAQASNVGIGISYPKITFTHRRKSRVSKTLGNTRNNRIIKDGEVPPNDALVIIDGRLVLERTTLIEDSIVIEGTQSGIVSITDCKYDNVTGLTTVTTISPHNFSIDDQVTMSGLAFTCISSGIGASAIFPAPQQSFVVDSIIGSVGTSLTFTTYGGVVAGIAHTYISGGYVGPLQMEFICSILESNISA
jgi:hypothetical protein